ncbi:MAG: glycosyltransferase, partial [Pedobacter sp.]
EDILAQQYPKELLEIIIADDGSRGDTQEMIANISQTFPVPLIHVWHEDHGFQLSKIRNKAIAKTSGDYIIQIDGDLILEQHFIQDHIAFRKLGSFVSGSRVLMFARLSEKLLAGNQKTIKLTSAGLKNRSNAFRFPGLSHFFASTYKANNPAYVRGCNMAFWKKDLIAVNGYNEDITGWGREDSELAIRLTNSGVKKKMLKFCAIAFHIYHPEATRARLSDNDTILEESLRMKLKVCSQGISSYL